MFNLTLLMKFGKRGKNLMTQSVLRHSTKPVVEMLCSSPERDQAVVYILWAFFKSDAFHSLLNWAMKLVTKKSHWLQL